MQITALDEVLIRHFGKDVWNFKDWPEPERNRVMQFLQQLSLEYLTSKGVKMPESEQEMQAFQQTMQNNFDREDFLAWVAEKFLNDLPDNAPEPDLSIPDHIQQAFAQQEQMQQQQQMGGAPTMPQANPHAMQQQPQIGQATQTPPMTQTTTAQPQPPQAPNMMGQPAHQPTPNPSIPPQPINPPTTQPVMPQAATTPQPQNPMSPPVQPSTPQQPVNANAPQAVNTATPPTINPVAPTMPEPTRVDDPISNEEAKVPPTIPSNPNPTPPPIVPAS